MPPPQMTLTQRQTSTLLVSVFIIAICGLIYELIIGALSSYLLGNSVTYFSLTIGLFMSAMGLGSFASRWVKGSVLRAFIWVEISIGIIGGLSAFVLYTVFATSRLYHVAMVILILLIGGLIGMEIPLLTQLAQGRDSLRETLANVLAFDYLGALLGAVLFPIILLPYLGLLKTAFAVGILNLLVASLILYTFRESMINEWQVGTAVLAILALCTGIYYANQLTSIYEQRAYSDEIIYSEQTPYQRIIMTRWRDDVRLYLDGNLQFSLVDEYRYHEALVHPAMTLTRSRENVLILGGGDGLAIRELLAYDDIQRIVLVDLDPAMTRLAQEHPTLRAANEDALQDERIEIVNADAYKFLEENNERFGVILIDLPDPNNESLGKLYSREFYELVQRHLAVGGIMTSQSTSPYFAREAYWSIVTTIEATGLLVTPYHIYVPTFGDWGFVMASHHPVDLTEYAATVPVQFLTSEILQRGLIFDADTERIPVDVSTLDTQAIVRYYEEGWKQWR